MTRLLASVPKTAITIFKIATAVCNTMIFLSVEINTTGAILHSMKELDCDSAIVVAVRRIFFYRII